MGIRYISTENIRTKLVIGNKRIHYNLSANVPIEQVIPQIQARALQNNPDIIFPKGSITLAPEGEEGLPPHSTLKQNYITEGTLFRLVKAVPLEESQPLIEDIVDAGVQQSITMFPEPKLENVKKITSFFTITLTIILLALIVKTWHTRPTYLYTAILAIIYIIAVVIAKFFDKQHRNLETNTAVTIALTTLPLLGYTIVPIPEHQTQFFIPANTFCALTTLIIGTLILSAVVNLHLTLLTTTLALPIALLICVGTTLFIPAPYHYTASATAYLVFLFFLRYAPRNSSVLGRSTVPHLPDRGDDLSLTDLPEPIRINNILSTTNQNSSEESLQFFESTAFELPKGPERATKILAGLLTAWSIAIMLLIPWEIIPHDHKISYQIISVALLTIALFLHSRHYTFKGHIYPLWITPLGIVLETLVLLYTAYPEHWYYIAAVLVVLIILSPILGFYLFGIQLPALTKRTVEFIEYICIALSLPFFIWSTNVIWWIRGGCQ